MSATFLEFCRACGVIPPLAIEPGRWIACATIDKPRKKGASIKLADDGQAGWVHDFRLMSEAALWRAKDGEARVTVLNADEIASRQAQRRKELMEATMKARAFYEAAEPLRNGHPYLVAKSLDMTGCSGLRVDSKGALVVPMFYRGKVLSVQRIMDDGAKWFWPGATTKGAHYTIDRRGAVVTLLCEGLATGLSLFRAVTNSRVIVAFNSGNLEHVAKSVTITGLCAVCADHDRETAERLGRNPGLDSAMKAAEILGAGVAVPVCENGTDFDDMRSERLAALREINNQKRIRQDSDAQLHDAARAPIRSLVMAAAKFVAPREAAPAPVKTRTLCPVCWREGRSLWVGSCKCIPGFPLFETTAPTFSNKNV